MDRLIRECRSMTELNRIIREGLNDELHRLATESFLELVLERGRTERDDFADTDDITVATLNDTDDVGAYSMDGVCERERNYQATNREMNETLPSTSTGATSTVDDIKTMEDIESLNRIIEEDNWTTVASGLAFQRILRLGGIENFDDMQGESLGRLDDLMEVIDADNMTGGDNPIGLDQNVSTHHSRHGQNLTANNMHVYRNLLLNAKLNQLLNAKLKTLCTKFTNFKMLKRDHLCFFCLTEIKT